MKAYQESIEQLSKAYHTNIEHGLTSKEVQKKRKQFGSNTIPEKSEESLLIVFIRQFKSPLIYILLAAALIIFFIGEHKLDAFIISGILIFNAIVGTVQEGRTRTLLHQLRHFFKIDAIAIRNGKHVLIQDTQLVPGDIILLREGEQISADARIIVSNNLTIDESSLTGESRPIRKGSEIIHHDVPLAEQKNMAFKGTYVMHGSGRGLVVNTGTNTAIGSIGLIAQEIQTEMPIKKELSSLSYIILLFIIIACTLLFIIGIILGRPTIELLTMLTALFICVIPEGLPIVLTLVLVTGVYRMAKQNVLIKKMQAVEALGRTQVIIIDKTGTLTRNEMMVSTVCTGGIRWNVSGQGYFSEGKITCSCFQPSCKHNTDNLRSIGIASALLNTAEITFKPKQSVFSIKGDPTEAALYIFSQKLGLTLKQLEKEYVKQYEIPFNPDTRYHAAFFEKNGQGIIFISGSPEEITKRSNPETLPANDCLDQLLKDGLRIVAFATKQYNAKSISPRKAKPEEYEHLYKKLLSDNLTFLGICGIQDSIRNEVPAIIKKARDAGITVVMATGDHKETASYIAKEVGLLQKNDKVIDGINFQSLSDEELKKLFTKVTVYSRLTPEDKLRLVNLFRQEKLIVAMTGDGINDVPPLVAADIGIAMGKIGTEIAKQTADIILLDDSFINIISAIEQGRHIFYSLKRVVLYFLSTNLAEVLIILFTLLLNLPLPFTAAQILWLNFVTDGFLDVGLAMEPPVEHLLEDQKWLRSSTILIDPVLLKTMIYMAFPMSILSLAIFNYYVEHDIHLAHTMTLLTMAFFQWFNAWNCRSLTQSLFTLNFVRNKWLIVASLVVILLQLAIVYIPIMQFIFKTVPLNIQQWGILLLTASTIIIWVEAFKCINYSQYRK